MKPPLEAWKPCAINRIQEHLGDFTDWVLCGGYSIDLLVGKQTRNHGDIDIGVFRSALEDCLKVIGPGRVFLCSPAGHVGWEGGPVDPAVHDIWISDSARENWVFQIMVYDDHGDTVTFRKDERIRWRKESHSIPTGGIRILNPALTLLYKSHKPSLMEKEAMDVATLIEYFGNSQSFQ